MSSVSSSGRPPPAITATENGPYEVQGVQRIVWCEPLTNDDGQPIAWRTREVLVEGEETSWLCRCGHSANKPFCDGSHRRVAFESADPATVVPRAERSKSYEGQNVVVDDDRSLCVHAKFCSTKTSNVWRMVRDSPTPETEALVVAMVQRCPSGALSVRAQAGGPDLEPPLDSEVAVIPDGPLWLTGGITVTKSDGSRLETRNRVTLCRCGASKTKPLCDGSHVESGFRHRPPSE